MSIYTRTGDNGTTALFGGKRVLKCEELVDVYGSIDELNSWIGLVGSKVKSQKSKVFFEKIQADLFAIGSMLAGWREITQGPALENRVVEMEKQIDEWEKELPQLNNFILPGGSELASRVHIARAICRRVERQAVGYFKGPAFEARQGRALKQSHKGQAFQEQSYKLATRARPAWPAMQEISKENSHTTITYFNRLSDLLFTFARIINKDANVSEIIWKNKTT